MDLPVQIFRDRLTFSEDRSEVLQILQVLPGKLGIIKNGH